MIKIEILVADEDEAQVITDVLTEAEEQGDIQFPFNTTIVSAFVTDEQTGEQS